MALESVFAIAPPLVGEQNKDTKNGDLQSLQNEDFEEDLEDGEILDSAGEEEDDKTGISFNRRETESRNERTVLLKDRSSPQLTKGDHVKEIFAIAGKVGALQAVVGGSVKGKRRAFDADIDDKNDSDEPQKLGSKKKVPRYVDHDFAMDDEDWSPQNVVFSKCPKNKDTHFDYSRELAAYRGSPYSSDSSLPYDDSRGGDSPNHRSRSPGMEDDEDKKIRKSKTLKGISKSRKSSGKIGKKRKILESRGIRRKKEHRIKTVCKFFMEGKCSKGLDCPFLHAGSPEKKKELCKFYLNGFCAKGQICLFMHEDFPCKFFHTGAKCFANEKCRFSHKPLSDETKRLLDRYLQSSHVDDDSDYHERPRREHKEMKGKRPCLLGSPPRHIKEAVETKLWQEEMIKLQQKGKGRSAFEIQVSPPREIKSPSKFSRPNFYTDTLQISPKKRPLVDRPTESRISDKLRHMSNECPPRGFSRRENDNQDWKNICDLVDKISPPKNEEASTNEQEYDQRKIKVEQECDQRKIKVEQECDQRKIKVEPTEILEIDETPSEFGEILSPRMAYEDLALNSELNDGFSNSENKSPKHEDKDTPLTAASPPPVSLAEPAPPPINIPSHLPRKQRELYLRIQQHQKEVACRDLENSSNVSESEDKALVETVKSVNDDSGLPDSKDKWYSSEDDDDDNDTDQPLANLLKKLHTTPSSKPETGSLPPVDVVQMIMSTCMQQQKGSQKTKSSALSEPDEFWKNILASAGASSTTKTSSSITGTNQSLPSGNNLPMPNLTISIDPRTSAQEQKPSIPRDPRLLRREQKMENTSKEPPILSPVIKEEKPQASFLSIDSGPGSLMSNRLKDINSMLQNQTPAVVVEGLTGMGNMPYKLHEVTASPPNYLSYIAVSQSDPKLLSDPRLRKHMMQGSNNQQLIQPAYQQCKSISPPNISPMLPLSSQNIQATLINSTIEKNVSLCVKEENVVEEQNISEPKQTLCRVSDPRIRRTDVLSDPRRASVNNTNHISADNTWIPPAPSIIPSPASHLPRGITDPRLAKLQRPLDPRRVKHLSEKICVDQKATIIREKQKLNPSNFSLRKPRNTPGPVGIKNTHCKVESSNPNSQLPDSSSSSVFAQKGKESEIVTKTTDISLSRKSSMTYTSPLNSYEDSVSDSKSIYNSYNRRPQKRLLNSIPASETSISNLSCAPIKEVAEPVKISPDFSICIPSVTESQCMDSNASLKDMFKTIDPTASPFC